MSEAAEALARRFEVMRPHLSEFQRRLWLGAEAAELGPGGVAMVARATGVAADTVRKGRAEASGAQVPGAGRSRRPGGGRKRAEAHDGQLIAALEELIDPATRGDPMSPLRWTCKSTRVLADALSRGGHPVSDYVVRRLLHQAGYSLQASVKVNEGSSQHPDRNAQFAYINERAAAHLAAGQPVISVDAKKKENVGEFKNGGAEWQPEGSPEHVNVHDFIDKDKGKVTPYGVYDVGANAGWVSVGTDNDTGAFAVHAIRCWWRSVGQLAYPGATAVLICADGGGSNGFRNRLWKTELAALAAETSLTIGVSHLPPGTSKWNKIEHRLFSHISMNWRGRTLTSHEVIVNTIAATTTRSGLTVAAELDTASYPKGIKITDRQIRNLEDTVLRRHEFHGEWNYTFSPPIHDTPEPG